MAPRAESRGPLARLTLAGGALLALLTVVAIASRSGLGAEGDNRAPDNVLLDRLFTVFLVLFLLYIPLAFWVYWTQRHALKAELVKRKRRSTLMSLVIFGLALVAVVTFLRAWHRFRAAHRQHVQAIPAATTKTTKGSTASTARYHPQFNWPAALVVSGLALTGVAAAAVAMRRVGADPDDELSLGERLDLALGDSLDDLFADVDPRHAVIAAYARMERALAAAGIPRAPHEAPFEYVDRALIELDVERGSVQRLTELYERARFSTHEIDEPMRAAAIGALAQVRDELRPEAA
jgi:Domain of unknown function (DUF4129)